ncbi:hypothetical protein B7494_g4104 [Chlorociboria aeruginascens]|nr:hypothetical protein B7494_g4104 [Chlorociboria aeruginascens]
MASYRVSRRLRRFFSSPLAQLALIAVFLFFGIRFIIQNNHDSTESPISPGLPITTVEDESIDWSKLYYVQYVTSPEYLCNALMIWSEIEEIGSRAQRLMLYPSNWSVNAIDEYSESLELTPIARLLRAAQEEYYVKLQPISVLSKVNSDEETWSDSSTKLLAFNLTSFDRVLALDSDSVVLQNLDELFLLPKATLAMPYVYWGNPEGWQFSSQLMLITPSVEEFSRIESAITDTVEGEYDMDIVNKLYFGSILPIPQRPYDLLTGEFRRQTHHEYLGNKSETWDPDRILGEAKLMHFSDWPVPKPWVRASKEVLNKYMPKCGQRESFGATDCRDRTIWLKFYFDFAQRRKLVCGQGFELQSQVLPLGLIFRNGMWYHPDEVG